MVPINLIASLTELVAGTVAKSNRSQGYNVNKGMNDAMALLNLKNQALSIAEQAKQSVMIYPMLLSTSITDTKLILDFCRYLEVQYSIFTMLTIGINYDTQSQTVKDKLNLVVATEDGNKTVCQASASDKGYAELDDEAIKNATEGFKEYIFKHVSPTGGARIGKEKSAEGLEYSDGDDAIDPEIGEAIVDALKNCVNKETGKIDEKKVDDKKITDYLKDVVNNYCEFEYQKQKEENPDSIHEFTEHLDEEIEKNAEIITNRILQQSFMDFQEASPGNAKETIKANKQIRDNMKESVFELFKESFKVANQNYYNMYMNNYKVHHNVTQVRTAMQKKIADLRAEPYVINLEFKFGKDDAVVIPIAIKCAIHALGTTEMRLLLESGVEGRTPSIRITKALTGEIKVIRDLIFQCDLAERDKRLYQALGRHPWFKKLQERKTRSLFNFFNKATKQTNVLPTSSLICTKDDLVLSTKIDYAHFFKDSKLIQSIMSSLFLLTIGIYDPEMNNVSFFFSGFNEPFVFSIEELTKDGSSDVNKTLLESLKNLSSRA